MLRMRGEHIEGFRMRYLVAACVFLLSAMIGQAQTLVAPSQAVEPNVVAPSPAVETNLDIVPNSSSQLATPDVPMDFKSSPETTDLPDAPSATFSVKPPTWNLAETPPPPAPRQIEPIWDKKMWAAHLILAGSMIFDVEMTHQGLAHHQCVEGNDNLESKPSRGELYVDNLKQFAPMLVMDWLGTATVRAGHLPRWFWKPLGYAGPIYGSFKHFHGGISWYTRC
jgi:hypothetical protein